MAALRAVQCQASPGAMVTPLWINEQWINPASAGFVNVLCSSSQDCSVNVVCGRQGGRGSTKPVPNSWLGVDLGPSLALLSCSAYTFSCNKFDNLSRALRNWEFQGSMDGKTWELIRKHDDDCSIPDSVGASATFEVDCKGRFFRQFRIVQTGPNSYRSTHGYIEDNVSQLTFGNMELYGKAIAENRSIFLLEAQHHSPPTDLDLPASTDVGGRGTPLEVDRV